MATTITGSPNISILDSKIVADLCIGKFYVDLSPSTWIGDGEENVLGANVKIVNPAGVTVKPYGSNYELAPALSGGMEAVISYNVPTIASNYMYGTYRVYVQLFDANGTEYVVEKSVTICEPDSKNKTRNYGTLSAKMLANCRTGYLDVIADTPPNYRGNEVQSQVTSLTLKYPTVSGVTPMTSTYPVFGVQLYEGVYLLEGTICALYDLGNNVYAKINYRIKREKNARCVIDFCCIDTQLTALQKELDEACTDQEKADLQSTILQVLMYVRMIELKADCDSDPSEDVANLEKLLGCVCTCNCAEGTPIIPTISTTNVSLSGCGFSVETVGSTTVYTINNYTYVVAVANTNGGILTITAASQDGCTKTQTITFDVAKMYIAVKAAINNSTEYNVWAAFINNVLNGLDVSCLTGVTTQSWATMTFAQRIQAIMGTGCASTCDATLIEYNVEQVGEGIEFTWSPGSTVNVVEIYYDGVLVATVEATRGEYIYATPDLTSETEKPYKMIPKCKNGSAGTTVSGTVNIFQRVFVAPPEVYTNNLQGSVPYDLTTNVKPLPLGITAEWHTANNTKVSSLVPNPTQANPGAYFVFGHDGNGFYSTGVQVTLVADETGSCTAPQNLEVIKVFGANQVQFQSAAYPPPLNSYTVKRRLTSDADVDANYTTLGKPAWNPSANRWIVTDNSTEVDKKYTYKAISNCGGTSPYISTDFADLSCPVLTLTPYATDVAYSFAPAGGEVDKYEVQILENGEVIHTNTHLSAFSNPVTGRFLYLDPEFDYEVRIKPYIGTYSKTCDTKAISTLPETATLTLDYVAGIWSAVLSSPISQSLFLQEASSSATGSNDDCATPFETDSMPAMELPAGDLGVEDETNGLSYLSEKYKISNTIAIKDAADNMIYESGSGGTFTVDGIVVTVQINHTECGYYPS